MEKIIHLCNWVSYHTNDWQNWRDAMGYTYFQKRWSHVAQPPWHARSGSRKLGPGPLVLSKGANWSIRLMIPIGPMLLESVALACQRLYCCSKWTRGPGCSFIPWLNCPSDPKIAGSTITAGAAQGFPIGTRLLDNYVCQVRSGRYLENYGGGSVSWQLALHHPSHGTIKGHEVGVFLLTPRFSTSTTNRGYVLALYAFFILSLKIKPQYSARVACLATLTLCRSLGP